MEVLPPLPSWSGMHPILVHLPLGILAVSPALALATLLVRPWRKGLALATLIVLAAGAGSAWIAVESGEAAAKLVKERAKDDEALESRLELHEELGEQARTIFAVLAAVYAFAVAGPLVFRSAAPGKMLVGAQVVFLILLGAGLTRLAWAGHEGGLLVHHHGVRADLPASPLPDEEKDHD